MEKLRELRELREALIRAQIASEDAQCYQISDELIQLSRRVEGLIDLGNESAQNALESQSNEG
jgi:hypothetical protein